MCWQLGLSSSSKDMGGGEKSDKEKVEENREDNDNVAGEGIPRQMSETSVSAAEDDDDEENSNKIQLGPQCTLKEQIEKDKVCVSVQFEGTKRWFFFLVCVLLMGG